MVELLSLDAVCKSYRRGHRRLRVLVDVSLEVRPREIVAVMGSRNEGKTTLLEIAAGLLRPDAGRVLFGDLDLVECSERERSRLLGHEIAWIRRDGTRLRFQVLDDLALPLVMGRSHGRREAENVAMEALERVGVPECARRRWEDLSNWERVMVGFARGYVSRPRLMIVDDVVEGFGMSKTRHAGELLLSLVQELGCGVLMSASNMEPALVADCVWGFERGRLKLNVGRAYDEDAQVIELHDGARQSRGSLGAGP